MSVEDPWDVPSEALVTPAPLIGFIGLAPDQTEEHRRVWELFSANRGQDRHAMNLVLLDPDHLELPVAKPPRTSYEWYLPRGILKRNWISKHLSQLPSVIVLFVSTPVSLAAVSSVVGRVRVALASRQTKLAVVVMQTTAEIVDQDTLTSICTECSIPARAVFCLPPGPQQLALVLEFEETLQELASNYYHGHIKTVKSHREQLNKATHLQLLVRHSFKVGFLSEVKGDLNSAYKSYTAAYLLLLESRLTEHNSCELRCVAGVLSYKICKLAFRLNLPRDAITQLKKHLEQWRAPPCPAPLSWEHAAWQSAQARHFAHLFAEACKAGQSAIQTQHPGVYYQLAAEYCISRRKLSEALCSSATAYPSPDPLEGEASMEFYGQRPWRVGKQEPGDLAKEKEGIEAMLCRERRVKHSPEVRSLLGLAAHQFSEFRCPRMVARLTVQTAEEMMVTSDYAAALATLLPCLPLYRRERWARLTFSLLAAALKCAFLSCDLRSYAALCLELCGLAAPQLAEEQARVWSNLLQMVEAARPPLPEPSLTAKSERASVGTATKTWTQLLGETQRVTVDTSEFSSCVDAAAEMPSCAKSDEDIPVKVRLVYRGSGQITVSGVQCAFTNSQYDRLCLMEEPRTFTDTGSLTLDFTIRAEPCDVGGQIQLKSVSMVLGSREEFKLTVLKHSPPAVTREVYFQPSHALSWASVCRVEPQLSQFSIRVLRDCPALVGEWFRVTVELTNTRDQEATELEVSCGLRDRGDPLVTDTTQLALSPAPDTREGEEQEGVVARLPRLGPGETRSVSVYVAASTPGVRGLVLQLSCLVAARRCLDTQQLELSVEQPFQLATSYLTEALEETTNCNTDEEFFVSCAVRNQSEHRLRVISAVMEGSQPVSVTSPTSPLADLDLRPRSSVAAVFRGCVVAGRMLPQLDSQTISPGRLVLTWARAARGGADAASGAAEVTEVINQTTFDLPSLKLSRATLYVECILPPYGVLRCQLQATYVFYNRTQDIQEFLVNIEPSDSFMFSGPKQSQIKLFPMDKHSFSLVIYPLVCGVTQLPKVKISNTEGSAAQDVLERLLPSTLVVVPKERDERERKLEMDKFIVTPPVVLENLPYVKKGVKA